MNIIIVGCGKVGFTIAQHLCTFETNNVVVIDKDAEALGRIAETLDVMSVRGNALSGSVLKSVGVHTTDLIICVSESDEANVLCCLTAKKLGARHTIARVRDPEYALELMAFRRDLGLDMIINPEQQAALEMSRLLRFPKASEVETFENGQIELVSFKIDATSPLAGKKVAAVSQKYCKKDVLFAAIEREGDAFTVSGGTVFQPGDVAKVLGRPGALTGFFKRLGMDGLKIKSATLIGGGKVAYYVAKFLDRNKIDVKIIEKNKQHCHKLNELLPDATVIHADGMDKTMLQAEDLSQTDVLVCLTGQDEENVIIGLYGKGLGVKTIIVKINFLDIALANSLDIGHVVCPKDIVAHQIIRYVAGIQNAAAYKHVLTMHMLTASIQTFQFDVTAGSRLVDVPIKDLPIKPGVLIASFSRKGKVVLGSGDAVLAAGDTVLVMTAQNINALEDILGP